MYSIVVVKVYNLCRVSNYSNSRVRGHGQLGRPYCFVVRCFEMNYEMTCDFDLTSADAVEIELKLRFPLEST
jgi:hypothetical protein